MDPRTSTAALSLVALTIALILAGGCTQYAATQPVQRSGTSGVPQSAPTRAPSRPSEPSANASAPSNTAAAPSNASKGTVDTGQVRCYGNLGEMPCPAQGQPFFGQDAQYDTGTPEYRVNGDGTVTDLRTGLMWTQAAGEKHAYYDIVGKNHSFAGYSDWRVPTVKELYSLIDFAGISPDSMNESSANLTPFINTSAFGFAFGNLSRGDRIIDSQWMTTNIYTSTVMEGQQCFFGVNFVDGRIKCYPTVSHKNNGYYVRYVRGPSTYGVNRFVDNHDGTVTDESTGLMWQQHDSGHGMDWEAALSYCQNLTLAGHSDWRLPNAKELEYIVNYSRSPGSTDSAAIDPVFETTSITDEAGLKDYPYFWTSTTHVSQVSAAEADYIAFGRAMGFFFNQWIDVHGAGAQRSDPKVGSASSYPQGRGPQGDAVRIDNYVRCVRGGATLDATAGGSSPSPQAATSGARSPAQGASTSAASSSSGSAPQTAIDACSGKSAGSSCSFTAPKGTVSGTCTSVTNGLACVP